MTQRRWIFLGLLIPAAVMTVVQVGWPDEGLEIACLVFSLPIFVVNYWEWFEPEMREWMLGKG